MRVFPICEVCGTVSRNMCKAWGQCGQGPASGRKILPRRHQLPGEPDGFGTRKPLFCWIFRDGTALAEVCAANVNGRAMRHLPEFCHAVCPWCRVVCTECHPVADLVDIVI